MRILSGLRLGHSALRLWAGVLLAASLPGAAMAANAGWRPYEVPVSASNPEVIPVALYYPTQTPAHTIKMGPFTVQVAIKAPPDATVKGLILLSHGTGGSETAHSSLAEALAQNGYLVAALLHPGDNFQDHSVWQRPPGAFFTERPGHASRVIDTLLADPEWKDRIAKDANGPRIGAMGHSAGGYTVVALAGGQPEISRLVAHCAKERANDPILCGMSRTSDPAQKFPAIAPITDKRVRAVVAMAPFGVAFTPKSLAGIGVPLKIYAAENDRWLVPRVNAAWIAQNVPGSDFVVVPGAWHFAFMDKPSAPIPTPDGDAAADPPGFDRAAFLARLRPELVAFFDKTLAGEN